MLVIPVAQEENVVRRHPWVAYSIVILNVLIFLGFEVIGGGRAQLALVQETRHEALELLARHPYLTVPPALVPALREDVRLALDRARDRAFARGRVPSDLERAGRQRELDELSRKFEAAFVALPSQTMGYVPARPKPQSLLTSMFMHAGWMHLIGNMLFFILTGPFIEDVYGRPLFAGFYVAGGIAATLAHAAAQSDSHLGLVGASGAIAAVMGAFLVRYGRRRIGFLLIPVPILPWIRRDFLMPAFVVIPFWFGQQLLFAHSDRASSTAWWAHIGGFVVGLAFAAALRVSRAEQRFIDPAIQKKVELVAHPALEQIVDARVDGRLDDARRLLDDALRRDPSSLDAWAEAYELGLAQADGAAAGRALGRLLDLYARAGENALAYRLVHDPRWSAVPGVPAQAWLSCAAWLEKDGDVRKALELYDEAARLAPADPRSLRALVRRAEILKDNGDHRDARLALERARAHPAYGPPHQATVEKALASLPRPAAVVREEEVLDV